MNYKNIALDKSMYKVNGKSFSDVLDELDPSSNYSGDSLSKLDAFSRQLKRFDIKVSGSKSDTISKFFSCANSATLFPEYVSRAISQGANDYNTLSNIIATKTNINSLDYRTISCEPSNLSALATNVAEGAVIPTTTIRTKQSLVNLIKRGTTLEASYEALKFQRIDLFTVTLKQIGALIAKSQLQDAINVIINGDGNSNPAQKIAVTTADSLSYADLISLFNAFDLYDMNTLLVAPDVMAKMLNIAELKDPATAFNFATSGKLTTPLGASLFKSSAVPAGTILALDKNYALEMISASDIAVDYDKLIDRQLERATITSIAGFSKIFNDASKVMEV